MSKIFKGQEVILGDEKVLVGREEKQRRIAEILETIREIDFQINRLKADRDRCERQLRNLGE